MTRYELGDRVQLHPATDAWMRGDRYGEIVFKPGPHKPLTHEWRALGRVIGYWVKLDKSGKTIQVSLHNILEKV